MKSLRITLSYHLSQVLWPALRVAAVIVAGSIASSPSFAQKDSGVPEDWSHHHVVFSNPRYVQRRGSAGFIPPLV